MKHKQYASTMLILMFLLGSSYSFAHEPNKYPLKPDQPKRIEKINLQRKNVLVDGLKKLRFGEASDEAVKDIGYEPDAYDAAPNKSLNQPPHHYIMSYFIKREFESSRHSEDQAVFLIFDRQERLTSIIFSGIPEVKQAVNPKIPVTEINEYNIL